MIHIRVRVLCRIYTPGTTVCCFTPLPLWLGPDPLLISFQRLSLFRILREIDSFPSQTTTGEPLIMTLKSGGVSIIGKNTCFKKHSKLALYLERLYYVYRRHLTMYHVPCTVGIYFSQYIIRGSHIQLVWCIRGSHIQLVFLKCTCKLILS